MTPERLPHLAGCYSNESTARIISSRLEASGLPVSIMQRDHKPRACSVIGSPDGRPDHTYSSGPVWLLFTDYFVKPS
jgi:hypothetical protein